MGNVKEYDEIEVPHLCAVPGRRIDIWRDDGIDGTTGIIRTVPMREDLRGTYSDQCNISNGYSPLE